MDDPPDFDVPFRARRRFLRQAARGGRGDGPPATSFAERYGADDLREAVSRLWSELATEGVICAANGFQTDQFGLDEELRPQLVLDDGYRIVAPDSHALDPDHYQSHSHGGDYGVTRQLADLIDLLAGEAIDLAERHKRLRVDDSETSATAAPSEGDIVRAGARVTGEPTNAVRQVIRSPIGEDLVIEHKSSTP